MLRIGIDIGGTFTDFIVYSPVDDKLITFKLLTNVTDPGITVLQGLNRVLAGHPAQIIHGSTVATNALLERKGARTALITTRGFKDVLQIGRQNRPDIYNWNTPPPSALVPSELRYEITERIDHHGNVLQELQIDELPGIINNFSNQNVESVAVCLLFSFLYPKNERLISEFLEKHGYLVSVSSEILPEFREYERTSTTVVNSYVSPLLNNYLSRLEKSLPGSNLQVMQSNGGMISLPEARKNGVRCILSGPAGGIVGAQSIAQYAAESNEELFPNKSAQIITFDMGGTSTDVSLIQGTPTITTESIIGGCPIHIPLLDIHTIGAGGGSIAFKDLGGSLRVGPQSAAANPGPACYGIGDQPTVTDANLVLGRLIPDNFLGGQLNIFPEKAFSVLSRLGDQLSLSINEVAFGIIDVVNIQMERALRVISVERGYDPHQFVLFSFGGAGGLHACDLARNLGIQKVLIPRYASTLSAFGMLTSNVIKDYVLTVMRTNKTPLQEIDEMFLPLVMQGLNEIISEGFEREHIIIDKTIDVRYAGQSYELNVPYTTDYQNAFHTAHARAFGYSYPERELELVNIRVRATGLISPIHLPVIKNGKMGLLPEKQIEVWFKDGLDKIPLYNFDRLLPGNSFIGPSLIVSEDTTILINHDDKVSVDKYQNLLIDISNV